VITAESAARDRNGGITEIVLAFELKSAQHR